MGNKTLLCNIQHAVNRFLKVITFCLFTSRDVPSPALPRRQRPDLGTVRPHVRQSHFVKVHWEKFLVLPKVAKSKGETKTEIHAFSFWFSLMLTLVCTHSVLKQSSTEFSGASPWVYNNNYDDILTDTTDKLVFLRATWVLSRLEAEALPRTGVGRLVVGGV